MDAAEDPFPVDDIYIDYPPGMKLTMTGNIIPETLKARVRSLCHCSVSMLGPGLLGPSLSVSASMSGTYPEL